ncbi:trihelix transcription factor GT-3b-like [Chenopodium quinoa]|uniref:trihelix transcription factor GT-3b-like n=1 Tax=Chenopodium quinoa TaxID=63459 RepID=UPI000B775AB5|nr:trihelix transcription factor GT-3b-like [Chenopodium quinoa]
MFLVYTSLMEGHMHQHHQHLYHHHQQQQQPPQQQQMSGTVGVDTGDRFPQWSVQETKEFLIIRADLDRNFMETKRNKLLWEVISTKMREKGFNRSAEQCKCKWKNLVTRYKGCETMEPDVMRQQFPFYNEMQAIFTARMQRMLWAEEEGGPGTSSTTTTKKNKLAQGQGMTSEEEEDEDTDGEKGGVKKKASKKAKTMTSSGGGNVSSIITNTNNSINAVKEMLEDFMKQQLQMEVQWREAYEAREEERRRAEMEWRQRMEALENERLVMERRWREREEQRKMREEARAEKRDALITTLLNKLRRED